MRFLDTPYGDIALWTYRPTLPFNESYEWFNFVQDSYSGKNRVTRFRNAPRHVMEIESPIPKFDYNNVYHLLHTYKTDLWGVPSWAEAQPISISAGATTLPVSVNESIPWVIVQTQYKAEPIFFDGGTFDPLENSYVNGIIAPLRIGRIVSGSSMWNNTISGRALFTFQTTENVAYEPDAPDQYKGYDIYTDTCSLFNGPFGIEDVINKRMDSVDSINGIINFNSPWGCSRRERDFRVFNNGQDKYFEFRDFIFRRGGRYRPFWMPTWNDDIRLASTGALGSTISIFEAGYGFCRSDIAVRRTNGTWLFREITDASLVGENIQLTLNSSLGIDASDVSFISYLGLHRLGTDRVEIGHITNIQSVSSVPIVEMDVEPVTASCA